MIRLENLTRAPISLHLEHDVYCVQSGKCLCTRQKLPGDAGKGKVRRVPFAIHLMVGVKAGPFHDSVLECPDVAAALARGRIKANVAIPPAKKKPVQAQAPKAAQAGRVAPKPEPKK